MMLKCMHNSPTCTANLNPNEINCRPRNIYIHSMTIASGLASNHENPKTLKPDVAVKWDNWVTTENISKRD